MTEATTHGDFLELLKLKTEIYQLKAENERLKAASSLIECKELPTLDLIKEACKQYAEKKGGSNYGEIFRAHQEGINWALNFVTKAATLPLPVESGWSDDDMKNCFQQGRKYQMGEHNEYYGGSVNKTLDFPEYLQSIKNQITT
jgi:hypothetical protein